ncbi:ABC transporter ATP-binding protein [Sporosarcina ureilytica]|uniref:Peptide ABC transporter substrate-binding protein n=1 Tax=Sporosarcina ureilytica TaxID=298596 RepID=A0A1D8JJ45_9BACL|nr:dipeptide ABC transporter ATP-binding protein [Sporosarcina ureilytica]AOV08722.1 peptide ABC transporter substrate-binding protein [Sporosarcina ureilytica]
MNKPIMEVQGLKKHFPIADTVPFKSSKMAVKAVDGIDFDLYKGETFGIVGESGCGKSTLARLINQLITPTSGTVNFNGVDLAKLSQKEIRSARKSIQMVFQNPDASLDPRKKIDYLISEPLKIHNIGTKEERKQKVVDLLSTVGMSAYHAERYPHEFSGGQKQRINIARALALNPDVVICDEPVSALDVSIQAQVINLLKRLQKEFDLTYIFISHDLNVVRYICDRIAVMYLGRIVEIGTFDQIYQNPKHPYTKALLSAIPKESPFDKKERTVLNGDLPSPVNPPNGCHFHTRCPFAMEKCKQESPILQSVNQGHSVSCFLHE